MSSAEVDVATVAYPAETIRGTRRLCVHHHVIEIKSIEGNHEAQLIAGLSPDCFEDCRRQHYD